MRHLKYDTTASIRLIRLKDIDFVSSVRITKYVESFCFVSLIILMHTFVTLQFAFEFFTKSIVCFNHSRTKHSATF